MNNIQEKDWAEESWHGHTGMDSASDYCLTPSEIGQESAATPGQGAQRPQRPQRQVICRAARSPV